MFLGLDIGTSAVKALVADEAQRVTASAFVPLTISRPHDLWSEQDPEDWWRAVATAIGVLREQAGPAWQGVRAIGLSGQMHSAVLVDAGGMALRPAMLWNDGRAHAEARELGLRLPAIGSIAGVKPMPGFTAPKIMWLKRHEPEVLAQAEHILHPKDFVRLRMTGSFATDMCDASGSLLLDTGLRAWSAEISACADIPLGLLPAVLEGTAVSGQLSGAVAAAWGLAPGTLVAAGAGDAAAGAIGIGAIDSGDAFLSLGTSALYFATRESYRPAPEHLIHTFCHGLPGRWFQMAAMLNGASCLAWAANLLGQNDMGKLLEETEARFPGPSPVLFLPYLTGERTPHDNPHAKGVLFGLTHNTSPSQVFQAVLEGVALAVADCQGHLAATGPLPEVIGATGGGSKSRFWVRLLASALGRSIMLFEGGEAGPAFGAARLARLALTGESPGTVCTKPQAAAIIAPEPELVEAYGKRLEEFRSLYQAVVQQF